MTIKLYIGAHKTATTHIQQILENSTKKLLKEDIKLSNPNDIRKEWMPNFLSYCANKDSELLHKLKSELPKQQTWIIAEENFSGVSYDLKLSGKLYPHLKKRLQCFKQIFEKENIEVFFSLRSYDTFYRSSYLEILRNKGYISFTEFYDHKRFKNNTWVDIIDIFTEIFPMKNITIWCYEDFNKLIPTILNKLTGIENTDKLLSAYQVDITRPSLSKTTVDTLESLHHVITQTESKSIIEMLNNKYPANKQNGFYLPFSAWDTNQYRSNYRKDLEIINFKYPKINFM